MSKIIEYGNHIGSDTVLQCNFERTGDGSPFLFTILKPFIYKGFRHPSGIP